MRLFLVTCLLAASLLRAQSPPDDREVSWKDLLPNIVEDQERIWSFPARLAEGQDIIPAVGVAVGVAGLATTVDPVEAKYFRNTNSFRGFNDIFTSNTTSYGMIAAPVLLYAAGYFRKDSKMKNTALLSGEAVADVEILTEVMKNAADRLRPSSVPLHGNYSDTWTEGGIGKASHQSFPSGHTIVAFSIATVVAHRYRNHRWVPWVAYGLAGAVGLSRLTQSAHFTADVFAGAALGYAVTRFEVLPQ